MHKLIKECSSVLSKRVLASFFAFKRKRVESVLLPLFLKPYGGSYMQYLLYLFRHVVTRIMMAAMDPKPKNLQENVILKFKNLKVITKAK